MSVTDAVQLITAITTLVTAIGAIIIAMRQSTIKKTTEETRTLVNGRTDAMMVQLEKQRTVLQENGIQIPKDASLEGKQ